MTLLISCLVFATYQVFVQSLSGTASLTWYMSYAPCCPANANYDPNADTTECDLYSACDYSGDFWALGHKSFNYVQTNNLVAFFDSSDPNGINFMTNYGGKQITLTHDGQTITAIIADSCGDLDCNGCCTRNAQTTGYLVDMEYYTAINNFGSIDTIDGQITFSIGETTSTSSTSSTSTTTSTSVPSGDNIMIRNQVNTEQYWVAFYIENVDLSCGGTITNVQIKDNRNYLNWVDYEDDQYGYYSFPNNGNKWIAPISVRITKTLGVVDELITKMDLISLNGDEVFNFGTNFCITITTTLGPTAPITLTPSPTSSPTSIATTSSPTLFLTSMTTVIPTSTPTLNPTSITTSIETSLPTSKLIVTTSNLETSTFRITVSTEISTSVVTGGSYNEGSMKLNNMSWSVWFLISALILILFGLIVIVYVFCKKKGKNKVWNADTLDLKENDANTLQNIGAVSESDVDIELPII